MRYSPPANWSSIAELRGLLFFAQRIEELTFSYSNPSYKSRTISIAGLILEAVECLKQSPTRPGTAGHVEHILDELRDRLSSSPAARATLRLPIEQYFALDLGNPFESANKLLSMRGELNRRSYISNIERLLRDELSSKASKANIDALTSELVSTVQYYGVSREHINRCGSEIFFGTDTIDSISVISAFIAAIFPHVHDFRVFLPIDENITGIDRSLLSGFNISILDEVPKDITKKNHGQFLAELKRRKHLCAAIEIESYDYHSAAEQAKDVIGTLSDLYRVFHHKWNHELGSYAVVEQKCCAGLFKEVNMPGNSMHYVKDSRPQRAQEMLSEALSSVTFVRGPDRSRYLSLISMHGLSLQSNVSDSQLINIWTCLETIVPPKQPNNNTSNVAHVVANVIPVIMLSYLKGILTTLYHDLSRWDKAKTLSAFADLVKYDPANPVANLLQLMTDTSHPKPLESIFAELDTFELLKYRLFRLSEMFRDRSRLIARVNAHERNVTWQLYRIYRARNKIVHAGQSSTYNKYLVENAHQYYDDIFDFCIGLSSALRDVNTFGLCFIFANEHYRHYTDTLNTDRYLESCIWEI